MSEEKKDENLFFQKIIRTADGTNEESDFFIMSIDKVRMDFIMTF